jgi:hypothetical protein
MINALCSAKVRSFKGNAPFQSALYAKHLYVACAALLGVFQASSATAFQYQEGDWKASVDTTVSYGINYRVEGQNKKYISPVNGGSSTNNTKAINSDDSNLNFRKGDVYSKVVKALSEMDLRYKDYGLFVRGRAFYDFTLEDNDLPHRKVSDDGLNKAGSDIDLLDAFAYGSWDINDRTLGLRFGRQVINWGESLFYQNGVAATNPTDLSALRAPGSELKEAFMPTFMTYGSYQLSETVTVSGYWQPGWAWEKTQLDPCGTYFANDFLGEGCNYVSLGGFDSPTINPATGLPLTAAQIGRNFVFRASDVEADSAAQYGAAVRWYLPELNGTELGFYYLRFSTQTPQVSGTAATTRGLGATASYFLEYLEKRDLFGVSFNSTVEGGLFDGQSIFGELTYRPDTPVALDQSSILNQVLRLNSGVTAAPGAVVHGYREKDMYQATVGTIRSMGRHFGADSLTLSTELIASRLQGLDGQADFGRVTHSAYGATVNLSANYASVFDLFNLVPSISHGRTFNGVSPSGTNGLDEEAWSTSLGVDAIYQDNLTVGARYVNFAGAENGNIDKDYLSFNVKYSF